jgi:uncharacterized protein
VKVGVISDTHLRGYDEKLRRILEHPFHGVDLILHAGDLTDLAVLDLFDRKEVRAVYGNADPPRVRNLLPDQMVLDINGFRLGLIHDCGIAPPMNGAMGKKFGHVDCLIFGHTHQPCNRKEGDLLYFNPGSATGNRFFPFNTVGILEVGKTITGEIIELRD